MYVPLQGGVVFPLLFFLKVAFACMDGMCSNFISQGFFFLFLHESSGGGGGGGKGESLNSFYVAASRVPSREDVISDTMIILLVYLQNQEIQYLDLQYLDIFHSNATYVKGLQEK